MVRWGAGSREQAWRPSPPSVSRLTVRISLARLFRTTPPPREVHRSIPYDTDIPHDQRVRVRYSAWKKERLPAAAARCARTVQERRSTAHTNTPRLEHHNHLHHGLRFAFALQTRWRKDNTTTGEVCRGVLWMSISLVGLATALTPSRNHPLGAVPTAPWRVNRTALLDICFIRSRPSPSTRASCV